MKAPARTGVGFRFVLLALCAVAAYVFSLQFIFPHYIAPFAPFHSDMYLPADKVALGRPLETLLFAPRPMLRVTMWAAGYFGVEGSALFITAITFADLVLAVTLLERFFLKRPVPIWIAFGTFLFAIAGPSFYFAAGYDIGSAVAMLCGFAGMWWWESGRRDAQALVLTGVCFALSTLAKEGFIPALFVYAAYAAWREPLPQRTRLALVALPIFATLVALTDGLLTHTPFVQLHPGETNPYTISLAAPDVLASARYYFGPLFGPLDAALFAALALGIWACGRARLGLGILATAFAVMIPYLVLPNHRLEYYQWIPVPFLMLLVPLAWSRPRDDAPAGAGPRLRRNWRAIGAVLVPVCLAAVMVGRSRDVHAGWWSLQQQDINRSVLAGIRSVGPQVAHARAVLVCGLSYPFHPWRYGDFLNRDLRFDGEWTVATEPALPQIAVQRHARPIGYDQIRLRDYDVIVIFGPDGKLVGAYRPEQLDELARRRGLAHAGVYRLVTELRRSPTTRLAAPS